MFTVGLGSSDFTCTRTVKLLSSKYLGFIAQIEKESAALKKMMLTFHHSPAAERGKKRTTSA